jgi:hypothetical protein
LNEELRSIRLEIVQKTLVLSSTALIQHDLLPLEAHNLPDCYIL